MKLKQEKVGSLFLESTEELSFPKINLMHVMQNVIKFSYRINTIRYCKKPIPPRMGFFMIYQFKTDSEKLNIKLTTNYSLFNNRSTTANFLNMFARRLG